MSAYGTVPYADLSPAWLAFGSYVLMFGMMFGDVGDGLLLIAAAIAIRAAWPRRLSAFRSGWPFVAGAGVAAAGFGFAYGEFFGPTGVIPAAWLDPIARPIPLLVATLTFGTVLLAGAYVLAVANRWREGGLPVALYAPSGLDKRIGQPWPQPHSTRQHPARYASSRPRLSLPGTGCARSPIA